MFYIRKKIQIQEQMFPFKSSCLCLTMILIIVYIFKIDKGTIENRVLSAKSCCTLTLTVFFKIQWWVSSYQSFRKKLGLKCLANCLQTPNWKVCVSSKDSGEFSRMEDELIWGREGKKKKRKNFRIWCLVVIDQASQLHEASTKHL